MIDIKQIKPKKNKSDKYSIQLYNYLKRNYPYGCSIFYVSTQGIYDKALDEYKYVDIPFDSNNLNLMSIWVGSAQRDDDWMYGNSLRTILGDARDKYTVFANPWNKEKTVIDITDWFWDEYVKVGRCIWDRQHNSWLAYDENRFTNINKNSRRCNWCGKWQHREISKNVWITRKEVWCC